MSEDAQQHKHVVKERGINHLTTDNMIYNCLRENQPSDELLSAFNIRYMDSSFADQPTTQEMNSIYIVRKESQLITRNYDSHEFKAEVDVIIAIRQYDTVTAQKILKSMYKTILHHLVNSDVFEFLTVENFRFEYREPGVLDRGVISFIGEELENFCYDVNPEPIKILLGLTTNIEGTNEKSFRISPKGQKLQGKN